MSAVKIATDKMTALKMTNKITLEKMTVDKMTERDIIVDKMYENKMSVVI
jgi:hypothetical protein